MWFSNCSQKAGGTLTHFIFRLEILEIHETGVPLNHPFVDGIFHEINPAFLGYSPVLETPILEIHDVHCGSCAGWQRMSKLWKKGGDRGGVHELPDEQCSKPLLVHDYRRSGWWFGTCFCRNIWDNPSHWLIFFRGVETTNQYLMIIGDYTKPKYWGISLQKAQTIFSISCSIWFHVQIDLHACSTVQICSTAAAFFPAQIRRLSSRRRKEGEGAIFGGRGLDLGTWCFPGYEPKEAAEDLLWLEVSKRIQRQKWQMLGGEKPPPKN